MRGHCARIVIAGGLASRRRPFSAINALGHGLPGQGLLQALACRRDVEAACLATVPGKALGAIVINGLHRSQRAIGVHTRDHRDPASTAG
jgi:hypothetical protein